MALFKVLRGSRTRLDTQEKIDGHAYFCPDDGSFHIDYTDDSGVVQRKQLNAKNAQTLTGKTFDQIKAEILAAVPGADTSNLVTLNTEQTISANKEMFNSTLLITQNYDSNKTDYIQTSYGANKLSVHKFMDSAPSDILLPVDELTSAANQVTLATREWVGESTSDFVTQDDLNKAIFSATEYRGTIADLAELGNVTTSSVEVGDYFRATGNFTIAGVGDVKVGDMLFVDTNSSSVVTWKIGHMDMDTDTDTWQENSATADGYVLKGEGNPNKVWMTDNLGAPAWREIDIPEAIDTSNFVNKTDTDTQVIYSPLEVQSNSYGPYETSTQYYDGFYVWSDPNLSVGTGTKYGAAEITLQDVDYSNYTFKLVGEAALYGYDQTLATREWVNENMPEAVDTSKFAKIDSNNTLDGVQTITGYYTSEDPTTSYTTRVSRSGVDVFGDLNYSPYVIKSTLGSEHLTFTKGDYMSQTTLTTSYKAGQIVNSSYTLTLPVKGGTLAILDDIPSLEDYVTQEWVLNQNYLISDDLSLYAKLTDIPDKNDFISTTTTTAQSTVSPLTIYAPSKNAWTEISPTAIEVFDGGGTITLNSSSQTLKFDSTFADIEYSATTIKRKELDANTEVIGDYTYTFPNENGRLATQEWVQNGFTVIDKPITMTADGYQTRYGTWGIDFIQGNDINSDPRCSLYFPEEQSTGTIATKEWANTQFMKRTEISLETLQQNLSAYHNNGTIIQIEPIAANSGANHLTNYICHGGPCFFIVNSSSSLFYSISASSMGQSSLGVTTYSLSINSATAVVNYTEYEYTLGDSSASEISSSSFSLAKENCKIYVFE